MHTIKLHDMSTPEMRHATITGGGVKARTERAGAQVDSLARCDHQDLTVSRAPGQLETNSIRVTSTR